MSSKRLWGYIFLLSVSVLFDRECLAQQLTIKDQLLQNEAGFAQKINTYEWWYGFNYRKNVKQKGLLLIDEDFKSSLLRIRANERKWKDDQKLNVDFAWEFTPKWTGKLTTSSVLFSDKLSGIKNVQVKSITQISSYPNFTGNRIQYHCFGIFFKTYFTRTNRVSAISHTTIFSYHF